MTQVGTVNTQNGDFIWFIRARIARDRYGNYELKMAEQLPILVSENNDHYNSCLDQHDLNAGHFAP